MRTGETRASLIAARSYSPSTSENRDLPDILRIAERPPSSPHPGLRSRATRIDCSISFFLFPIFLFFLSPAHSRARRTGIGIRLRSSSLDSRRRAERECLRTRATGFAQVPFHRGFNITLQQSDRYSISSLIRVNFLSRSLPFSRESCYFVPSRWL